MDNKLIEGVDYIFNDQGLMILTKEYLLKRGRCCQSGCLNCPYGYAEQADPSIPSEFQSDSQASTNEPEIYSGDIPEEFQ